MPNGALRVYEYAGHGALVPLAFTDYASADASPESGKHYTVFTDPVGQPLQIEDAKGQLVWFASRVDPYGHIEVHPASQLEYNLRWPGHYYDPETALHYNRYRYYDPGLGRYLQTDPLGYEGSPTNLYGYPANPLTDVDVLGLTHPHADDGSTPPRGPAHGGTEDLPDNTFRDSRGRLRDVDSGRYVTDPHATGDYTPDVLATKTRNTAMDGAALDPADPRVARALADRDAAMTDRNRLLAAGDERGAAQAQARANKATEHLGNMAADAAVQRAYPGAKTPPLHSGEGPGTFDRVYENGSPPPQHIIAEGKGGTATNSSSRVGADGQRHQQGSPGYRDSVIDNMGRSSDTNARGTAESLRGDPNPAYVEVHQPINTTTDPSGTTTSTLGTISGSNYGAGRPRTP
jgi:RHS repeat-associated protein